MKILCLGHVTYDITFPTNRFPLENTKNRYHEKEECTGGIPAISAFLLSKWNMTVDIAGLVGNDDYGKRIQKEFSLNRVGTNYLTLSNDVMTSHSLILANRENGLRTIFCYTPRHVKMKPFKLNYKPDVILLDGYEYEASKKILRDNNKAISVMRADTNKKETIELAQMTNYLICSMEFAESVSGIKFNFDNKKTLVDAFTKIEALFKNTIVITLGTYGCLYKQGNLIKIMPSIRVKTIDSTGAGDIFCGAFTYGIANNFSLEKTLKYANIAGALSVTRTGGHRSIPTIEEMNEVYEQVK